MVLYLGPVYVPHRIEEDTEALSFLASATISRLGSRGPLIKVLYNPSGEVGVLHRESLSYQVRG